MDNISRGWNDPPPVPLGTTPPSGSAISAKRSGINLNKRIAFPLSGPPSSTSPANVASNPNMPPMVVAASPPKSSIIDPSSAKNSVAMKQSETLPSDFDSDVSLLETFENLNKYLKNSEDLEHKSDVERRLTEMKTMWSDNLLSKELCYTILRLSRAIDIKDLDVASSLQLEIVSKWPSESSKWVAGVRRIVNHIRLNLESTNCDDATDAGKQEAE